MTALPLVAAGRVQYTACMFAKRILQQSRHRPWALPQQPWIMSQVWLDLLFAHWPIAPAEMAALLPPGLELDTFEGQAWIAVVPFRMEHVKPRATLSVPGLSFFPELNVRTYVRHQGKSGVWFFSLDAANALAVKLARAWFQLPYFHARMQQVPQGNYLRYTSHRIHKAAHPAELKALYRPTGAVYTASPGSLEHWLTERYCLYTTNRQGELRMGEIHHLPWPLQPAEAEFQLNTMVRPTGLVLPDTPPLLHFVKKLEVVVWPLQATP